MTEFYRDDRSIVLHGTALEALKGMPDNSVDAVVTDPPYALTDLDSKKVVAALTSWTVGDRSYVPDSGKGFRGMDWDKFVPPPSLWDECIRVLKPGGYLLAFAGARTQDLMGISIRISGFDIKDGIGWVSSQGFPKSLDVGKAVDKHVSSVSPSEALDVVGSSEEAVIASEPQVASWDGYGTAMKPSFEPIIVAQKPIGERSIVANVLRHGTGALNINATRVGGSTKEDAVSHLGRWTPNFVLSHSEECFQSGAAPDFFVRNKTEQWTGFGQKERPGYSSESISFSTPTYHCVEGCPVRLLAEESNSHAAKVPGEGVTSKYFPAFLYHKKASKQEKPVSADGKTHVSVKPLELMQWLVRLVTPQGGVVLDPFLGSGTTVEAARREGILSIGVEGHQPYLELISQRLQRS